MTTNLRKQQGQNQSKMRNYIQPLHMKQFDLLSRQTVCEGKSMESCGFKAPDPKPESLGRKLLFNQGLIIVRLPVGDKITAFSLSFGRANFQ